MGISSASARMGFTSSLQLRISRSSTRISHGKRKGRSTISWARIALRLGIVLDLRKTFEENGSKPVDLFYACRCKAIDIITYLCFANSVDAVYASNYEAPIILAMDASMVAFLLKKQINDLYTGPSALAKLPHNTAIYHELLRPEAYKTGTTPDSGSLYEESQAPVFGGADTTGATLMHGSFCSCARRRSIGRLRRRFVRFGRRLRSRRGGRSWRGSRILCVQYIRLEITAVMKGSLCISPGVASPLPPSFPMKEPTLRIHLSPEV
ncbi:hypothetical protein ASPCAL01625 [Aspergillus calidoustus]|uniref:Uncharacterized protein n=1 Tax=Aspergillus calidoustus TaxID=454130 RepID=A0A0U5FRA4_ASPCI|nr:hypothetical protein ASPCAL01625 [Aspergillus calidoustus]